MGDEFTFSRQGRTPMTLGIVICIYAALLAAVILIDAAWWLVALLTLPTLPALWDLYADPSAGLRLNGQRLAWHSGRRSAQLDLDEIDHMRFDTRWDFSVRVAAVLKTGRQIRLPQESLPPHRRFEAELQARGMRVERHHFRVF